jgi:hypothetical protein
MHYHLLEGNQPHTDHNNYLAIHPEFIHKHYLAYRASPKDSVSSDPPAGFQILNFSHTFIIIKLRLHHYQSNISRSYSPCKHTPIQPQMVIDTYWYLLFRSIFFESHHIRPTNIIHRVIITTILKGPLLPIT